MTCSVDDFVTTRATVHYLHLNACKQPLCLISLHVSKHVLTFESLNPLIEVTRVRF